MLVTGRVVHAGDDRGVGGNPGRAGGHRQEGVWYPGSIHRRVTPYTRPYLTGSLFQREHPPTSRRPDIYSLRPIVDRYWWTGAGGQAGQVLVELDGVYLCTTLVDLDFEKVGITGSGGDI